MQVDVVFVKFEGEKRIEIPYEELTEEQKREQALKLTKRFFSTLGIEAKEKAAI